MEPRIIDVTYRFGEDFARIYHDASTPPWDRIDIERWLRHVDEAIDPRVEMTIIAEAVGLLELRFRAPSSGNIYGVLLIDMGIAADAIAYWREPPLYRDPNESTPHGFSREHAIEVARVRMEALR